MKQKLISLLKELIPNFDDNSYTSTTEQSLCVRFPNTKFVYTWNEVEGFFTIFCYIDSDVIHSDRETVLKLLNQMTSNGSISYMIGPNETVVLRMCCYISKDELNIHLLNEIMFVMYKNANNIISVLD